MKAGQYGLTAAGFAAKPLSVLLDEEREAFRNAFGDDVDVSGESIAGAYIGNQAAKLAELWSQLEGLWLAGDRDSASGAFLDRLAALVNVNREAAQPTQVTACVRGAEGTELPRGTLARLLSTGDVFSLARTARITRDSLLEIEVDVGDAPTGAPLALTVNGTAASVTTDDGDAKEAVRDRLADAAIKAFGDGFIVEKTGAGGVTVRAADGVSAFSAGVSGGLEISSLGSPAVFAAREAGRIYAPAGTLTVMVSNVQGVDSITNFAEGTTGRAAESDTELRTRLGLAQRQATATETAIQNALARLDGVTYARVYSNRGDKASKGRPPKSYEAVVVGGDDGKIAECIFKNGPAGIQAHGNKTVTVRDSEGFDWSVGFSRPVSRYIWIKIKISLYGEEDFPANGLEAIKDNILAWGADNLDVAVDVIYQRLLAPIYTVPGIASADIKVAATSSPDTEPAGGEYRAANVAIGEVEMVALDRTRISAEIAEDAP